MNKAELTEQLASKAGIPEIRPPFLPLGKEAKDLVWKVFSNIGGLLPAAGREYWIDRRGDTVETAEAQLRWLEGTIRDVLHAKAVENFLDALEEGERRRLRLDLRATWQESARHFLKFERECDEVLAARQAKQAKRQARAAAAGPQGECEDPLMKEAAKAS
jgi:hypothetical protein